MSISTYPLSERIKKRKRGVHVLYDPELAQAMKRQKAEQVILERAYRGMANKRTGGYMGIELKFYDSASSGALVAPTDAAGGELDPGTDGLSTIAQGDGEQNRDGRQVYLKKVSVKGVIEVPVQTNATALDVSPTVYVALVLDKQTNGAQLNSEDVFTNPGGAANLACAPFRNLQYTKRFRVLKTVTIQIPQLEPSYDGTNIEISGCNVPFEMHKDLNLETNYSGTTAVIANSVDHSIHVIAYTSSTTFAPTLNYNSRVRFVG